MLRALWMVGLVLALACGFSSGGGDGFCTFLADGMVQCVDAAATQPNEDTGPVCTTGVTQSCTCTNGASGNNACAEDGSMWLPCECATPEPPEDTPEPPDDVPTDTIWGPDWTDLP